MDNEELFEEEQPSGFKSRLPRTEKLKPITMHKTSGRTGTKYEDNKSQQIAMLGALAVTSDPKKLKEMVGLRTVAEVYRTLDKMAIRREFHSAFDRAGISFDFIINGIKREAVAGDKSADRIKAFELLLKSLGLDKYEDTASTASSSWEEKLIQALESKEEAPALMAPLDADYEVKEPVMPESAAKKQREEEEMGNALFNDFPKP